MARFLRRLFRRPPTIGDCLRAAREAPCEPALPPSPPFSPDLDLIGDLEAGQRAARRDRRALLAEIPVRPYDRTSTPEKSPLPPIRWEHEA